MAGGFNRRNHKPPILKKANSIKNKTLEANRYFSLFCPGEGLSAEEAIALYRWRW
jgi:hypothetical protein